MPTIDTVSSSEQHFFETVEDIPILKDAPKRVLSQLGKEAQWFCVPAGEPLIKIGEPANLIYFVLNGAFGAFRIASDGSTTLFGHIKSGEPIGESSLLGLEQDNKHIYSVYALRDSEVFGLTRNGIDQLITDHPNILKRLARVILLRSRQRISKRRILRYAPKVFTLLASSPSIDIAFRANLLAEQLKKLGVRTKIVSRDEGLGKSAQFFDECEHSHDIVFLTATISEVAWLNQATRQADRIWIFGREDSRPSQPLLSQSTSPVISLKLVDVVLLHNPENKRISNGNEWLNAANASRVFHWTGDAGADCDRLARVICGKSIGLVLSGGGARAFSHVGVLQALEEHNWPIDFIGGTSMGAVIGAGYACGWSVADINKFFLETFLKNNPMTKYRLPVVGFINDQRLNNLLAGVFGERDISDLNIPFFAVSTNLSTDKPVVHRKGMLRQALRTTVSLPGLIPPVVKDGNVLVDGALINNFPMDVMVRMHRGFNIGCDVARVNHGIEPEKFIDPPNFLGWIWKNGFLRAPPIVSLLMRSGSVGISPNDGQELADLMILPKLEGTEINEWRSYEKSREEGYATAVTILNKHPRR